MPIVRRKIWGAHSDNRAPRLAVPRHPRHQNRALGYLLTFKALHPHPIVPARAPSSQAALDRRSGAGRTRAGRKGDRNAWSQADPTAAPHHGSCGMLRRAGGLEPCSRSPARSEKGGAALARRGPEFLRADRQEGRSRRRQRLRARPRADLQLSPFADDPLFRRFFGELHGHAAGAHPELAGLRA